MKQKVKAIAKSALIILLVILVSLMMYQIEKLQGTARVLNYAGLVRGATQREVKLEITGNSSDDLYDASRENRDGTPLRFEISRQNGCFYPPDSEETEHKQKENKRYVRFKMRKSNRKETQRI